MQHARNYFKLSKKHRCGNFPLPPGVSATVAETRLTRVLWQTKKENQEKVMTATKSQFRRVSNHTRKLISGCESITHVYSLVQYVHLFVVTMPPQPITVLIPMPCACADRCRVEVRFTDDDEDTAASAKYFPGTIVTANMDGTYHIKLLLHCELDICVVQT